jgi:hypothetical protein
MARQDRVFGVKLTDPFGFERTLLVGTTDLAIPNRKTKSDQLEGGVLPVTIAARNEISAFALSLFRQIHLSYKCLVSRIMFEVPQHGIVFH